MYLYIMYMYMYKYMYTCTSKLHIMYIQVHENKGACIYTHDMCIYSTAFTSHSKTLSLYVYSPNTCMCNIPVGGNGNHGNCLLQDLGLSHDITSSSCIRNHKHCHSIMFTYIHAPVHIIYMVCQNFQYISKHPVTRHTHGTQHFIMYMCMCILGTEDIP